MKAAKEFIAGMEEQISMPDIYTKIRQLIRRETSDTRNYVKLIEKDSVLSTRLMRMANSHYFGYPDREQDLYQTINLIGTIQLHDFILASLSLRFFAAVPEQIFNLEAFWKYSVECGIAARTIAQHSQISPVNPYFTFGLLHEIGHAAMFIKQPELSLQTINKIEKQGCSVTETEQEYFGFDYTQVGVELMRFWNLPMMYQQITQHHLHPEQADKAYQQAVKIIHLAHSFCQDPVLDKHRSLFEKITQNDPQLKTLPADIDQLIISEISENTDSILHMLWPNCIIQQLPLSGQVLKL